MVDALSVILLLCFLLLFFLQKDMNALHFAAQHGLVNVTILMLEAKTHTDVVDSVSAIQCLTLSVYCV